MGTVKDAKKLRIGFMHPDLGIGECRIPHSYPLSTRTWLIPLSGGAERLVVDAAVSLQKRGHEVVMFTSRHDPKRCFEETRDGEHSPLHPITTFMAIQVL